MGEQEPKKAKKHICAGLLAHVDAGKTTLSEGMLYVSGAIRRLGRVDYRDAFLDTYAMERARGITIFSKQALLAFHDCEITLLDTPGHVDFSAEMERTLQVLDYAVLVISGADGVQGHTLTLWKLLARYKLPTFIFINKMDQTGTDRDRCLDELQKRLDGSCLDFSGVAQSRGLPETSQGLPDSAAEKASETAGKTSETAGRMSETAEATEFWENLAMCDETLLDRYLETGKLEKEDIQALIHQRKVFPCYFGSALKLDGVEALLRGIAEYSVSPDYTEEFGARVFKISRDGQGNRLTHMKITGGRLRVRDSLTRGSRQVNDRPAAEAAQEAWEEKVNQIRIYSGAKFEAVNEAVPGMVCTVTGLTKTYAGEGLGKEGAPGLPILEPVLSYQIQLPEGCDIHQMLGKLRLLEEEEPLLHIAWREELGEIHAQLMGEVQIELLKSLILERFGVEVSFGAGNIVYKETIQEPVEGAGHFEPLRHYAEVHLLMEPGERGSGLQFGTACSEDVLDRNWQRLVLTHLEEKEHRGVLTGAPITDMHISLIAGRAHIKHTEGGDFRQATYRAVRQGLQKAKSILLEPYYQFRLEIPSAFTGRAMTDIQKMSGTADPPVMEGDTVIFTGTAPVVEMQGYMTQVLAYSKGMGRLFCTLKGYEPCHNAEEVIAQTGYEPELDLDNPSGSVFCSHGAGFVVPWDEADAYMHVDGGNSGRQAASGVQNSPPGSAGRRSSVLPVYSGSLESDKELEEIFRRTYGESKRERALAENRRINRGGSGDYGLKERVWKKPEPQDEYLLVDGYNIIFAWEELKDLSRAGMDGARHRLMDILCNYQGFKQCHVILVFDAYKVEGHACEVQKYHNIYVVYTKEAETADQYIEKTVHELGRKYRVTVATSDGTEQVIILGQGGLRMSAQELKEEIDRTNRTIREEYLETVPKKTNLLFQNLDGEAAGYVEAVQNGTAPPYAGPGQHHECRGVKAAHDKNSKRMEENK